MRRSVWGKMLALAIAAAVAATSSVSSFAAEEIAVADFEEAVIEEVSEDFEEEELYEEAVEAEEVFEEEEPSEEVFEEDVIEEEEAVFTEGEDVQPIEDGEEEPGNEPGEPAEQNHVWKQEKYTVVFHSKVGGKDNKVNKTYTYADKDELLSAPFEREGYAVYEWNNKKGEVFVASNEKVDFLVEFFMDPTGLSKIDLYANWQQNRFSIVFHDDEGNRLAEQPEGYDHIYYEDKVDFRAAANEFNKTATEDFTVIGFSTVKDGDRRVEYTLDKSYSKFFSVNNGELDLYPVIGQGRYTIFYLTDSNTRISKMITSYKSGERVVLSKATRPGHKFMGWQALDKDGTELAEDELKNVFETKKVKDVLGNDTTVVVAIKKTAKQPVYLVPFFNINTYKLYVAPNAKGVTLAGKPFSKKVYVGTFSYNGERETIKDDGREMESDPEKIGSRFVGYSVNAKAKTAEECINVDDESAFAALTDKKTVTLYCIWEQIPYSVVYQNEAYILDRTSAKELEECDFTPVILDEDQPGDGYAYEDFSYYGTAKKVRPGKAVPGCTFIGWRVANGSADTLVIDKSGIVSKVKANNQSDVVLVGLYSENCAKLKFDTCGGTIVDPKTGKEVKGKISPLGDELAKSYTNTEALQKAFSDCSNVKKDGYVLKGLFFDKKGKKPVTLEGFRASCKKNNATVTIYAVWDKQ